MGTKFKKGILLAALMLAVPVLIGPANAKQSQAKQAAAGKDNLSIPVRRLLQKVRICMDKEDYSGAVAAIRESQKSKKKDGRLCSHPLVCLALGNSHLLLSDHARAESAYLAALDMDPEFMDARVNLAKVYTDTNQYAKAAKAFFGAYSLSSPKHPDYLYYSAVMHMMDQKTPLAIKHFDTLFAAHKDRVTRQWKENYANALMTAQRWKRAVPLVKDLIAGAQGKEKIKWQETLLQIYLTTNEMKRARDYATALCRQAPTVSKWWKALVHVNLSLGHYDKALDGLIIYGFLTPLSREEQKLFADLSLQLNIPRRAAGLYEALLAGARDRTGKKDKQLLQHLVTALRQTGKGDQALAALDRFAPKTCDPELLILKGDILYEAENYKAANAAYRMAAREKKCPRRGQAWLMAGYAAWQHNDLTASRQAFENAARFKGFRKDALAAIAQMERTKQM
ncbi:MAG: tetratricopeptide repeat protein [Desulfobacter sp.]|nr:MAG: tetratricopeptide repeat protein [Desulfobacter sp.]